MCRVPCAAPAVLRALQAPPPCCVPCHAPASMCSARAPHVLCADKIKLLNVTFTFCCIQCIPLNPMCCSPTHHAPCTENSTKLLSTERQTLPRLQPSAWIISSKPLPPLVSLGTWNLESTKGNSPSDTCGAQLPGEEAPQFTNKHLRRTNTESYSHNTWPAQPSSPFPFET